MRYGTIPLVRRTGGLLDTVVDMGDPGGYGIAFNHTAVGDITHAIYRAIGLYSEKQTFSSLRQKNMSLDFSWGKSADQYLSLYNSFD
jgi:starch synthase